MSYCIRITTANWEDMYLRHGYEPGSGRLVNLPTRDAAKLQAQFLTAALEYGDDVTVVRFEDVPEDER